MAGAVWRGCSAVTFPVILEVISQFHPFPAGHMTKSHRRIGGASCLSSATEDDFIQAEGSGDGARSTQVHGRRPP
ncbi:hypothetical protein EYF80_059253 [Liparis tanakae]|uniref:Uncharacterized protein n=1 Tax=Liparis tanakae TaxID=230148 RepID=A0A4Z2EP96_9TELE|nr:hypothetical protein EYF80_059253 [Liparis tanakae]